MHADGGGKVAASVRPINGRQRVARTLSAGMATLARHGIRFRLTEVNGQPGALAIDTRDGLVGVIGLDIVDGRIQTIRSIANRGEGPTLDLLLPLYDSERDNDLKNALLQAFGQYQDQRAYQKLEQVVMNTSEPIERRKTAINMLSRSSDPGVIRFMEGLIK